MTKADILNRLKCIYDKCTDNKAKDSILNLIVDIGSSDIIASDAYINPTLTNYFPEKEYFISSTLTTKKD